MWGRTRHLVVATALCFAVLSLTACWDNGDDHGSGTPSHTLGGTLSGLGSGHSVTLLNNGANALTRSANGSFTFSTPVKEGVAYSVTVGTQPAGQNCTVGNGSGVMGAANVTNVTVNCADLPRFTVGGTLSGLASGATVTLQNNGADALVLDSNGTFTFASSLAGGASYAVAVGIQPTGQTCLVSNGSGTVGSANVTDIAVACKTNPIVTYTVGGAVSGLGSGLSVTLLNNGGDALTRNSNGGYTFATALAGGATYAVTIGTQPTGQTCVVDNASGTIGSADVTNVIVTCSMIPTKFSVGGMLTGLAPGLSVTLLNNGGDSLMRSVNGAFTFPTSLSSGAAYAVTVGTQPTGQHCSVSNGTGTVASANVTNVAVYCESPPAWTWQGGSKLVAPAGIYGTKGVPSTANAPGGRNWNAAWMDVIGQIWVFGGQGYDAAGAASVLNDLWRYDKHKREWTWMHGANTVNAIGSYGTKGVADASNVPGAREFMAAWVDDNGDFWLFGGFGFDATGTVGYLSDLWRYQPSTNLWTWMGGPNSVNAAGVYGTLGVESATNQPGARWGAVAFQFYSGNLYMFGGYGVDSNGVQLGYLNDLWKFNPANGRWTWISGSNTFGAPGVYGTQGVAAATNVPGARNYTQLVPLDGAIWIFGGITVNASNVPVALNDLWRYELSTGQWTWISGANVPNSPGVYGTKGTPAPANVPGARGGMVAWSEPYIWVFGGAGYDSVGNGSTDLNDLWRFDPQTGLWTWMSGSNLAGAKGMYGTLGVPSTNNTPGARDSGTALYDWAYTGHAWLFGGAGYDSNGVYDAYGLNDVWELVID